METNRNSSCTPLAAVEEAAAAWLIRRDEPDWSNDDQTGLDRWLAASPHHRVAYIRLQSVWGNASRLKSLAAGLAAGVPARGIIEQSPFFALRAPPPVTAESAASRFQGRGMLWSVTALTASVLLVAFATWGLWQSGTSYSTPIGGLTTIPAQDGSTITLNTDTQLQIQLTNTERHVTLRRGEAYFEVAHDPRRPFIVSVGEARVIAVGTRFSVRTEEDGTRVSVTEGAVKLESMPRSHPLFGLAGPTDSVRNALSAAQLLPAGTIALANSSATRVHREPVSEVEQTLSWRNGYVVLTRTPLAQAVREFNRYNRRQLVLGTDPALQQITIGGNFRTNNLDGFLRLLEEEFSIRADSKGERLVLRRQ